MHVGMRATVISVAISSTKAKYQAAIQRTMRSRGASSGVVPAPASRDAGSAVQGKHRRRSQRRCHHPDHSCAAASATAMTTMKSTTYLACTQRHAACTQCRTGSGQWAVGSGCIWRSGALCVSRRRTRGATSS